MNLKKQMALVICLVGLSTNFITIAHAQNIGTSSIPVQYEVSKDSQYKTEVEVRGPGTVYDGTSKISNGIIVYELKVEQKKNLKLVPNKDAKVKKVIWDEKDVTKELSEVSGGYSLDISGLSADSKVLIEFENKNISNTPSDNNTNGDINDNNVNENNSEKLPTTGDDSNIGLLILICIGSFIALVAGSRKRFRKEA